MDTAVCSLLARATDPQIRAADPWDVFAALAALPPPIRDHSLRRASATLTLELARVSNLGVWGAVAPPTRGSEASWVGMCPVDLKRAQAKLAIAGPRVTATIAAMWSVAAKAVPTHTSSAGGVAGGAAGGAAAVEVAAGATSGGSVAVGVDSLALAWAWKAQLSLWVAAELHNQETISSKQYAVSSKQ